MGVGEVGRGGSGDGGGGSGEGAGESQIDRMLTVMTDRFVSICLGQKWGKEGKEGGGGRARSTECLL